MAAVKLIYRLRPKRTPALKYKKLLVVKMFSFLTTDVSFRRQAPPHTCMMSFKTAIKLSQTHFFSLKDLLLSNVGLIIMQPLQDNDNM